MLATWPYISPEFIFWTPIVLAFIAGWVTHWAAPTGWLLLLAVVLGAMGYSMMPASAHDHSRPGLDSWYQGLKSPAGAACCDGPSVDAVHLADVDWESNAGRYRVRIDGQWVDVPPGAVLDVPNRDGRTLVWPGWSDGKRSVRCFMPGAMT